MKSYSHCHSLRKHEDVSLAEEEVLFHLTKRSNLIRTGREAAAAAAADAQRQGDVTTVETQRPDNKAY
jgi:hypothetical protein